jgi:hypothetical protein
VNLELERYNRLSSQLTWKELIGEGEGVRELFGHLVELKTLWRNEKCSQGAGIRMTPPILRAYHLLCRGAKFNLQLAR